MRTIVGNWKISKICSFQMEGIILTMTLNVMTGFSSLNVSAFLYNMQGYVKDLDTTESQFIETLEAEQADTGRSTTRGFEGEVGRYCINHLRENGIFFILEPKVGISGRISLQEQQFLRLTRCRPAQTAYYLKKINKFEVAQCSGKYMQQSLVFGVGKKMILLCNDIFI